MNWNDKILDALDKEELKVLCNPLKHYNLEEDMVYFIVIIC
ncbi:MAG: hypothetical protein ACFFD2_04030 [Promethearchaeota archaeon]